MFSINKLMYIMLGLVVLMILGMLTASWRIILYPYLFVCGISVLIGMIKVIRSNHNLILIPVGLTAVYLFLFIWLDLITRDSKVFGGDSANFVFGLVPSTAIVLLGIWPISILAPLLYAWTFSKDSELASKVIKSELHGM
ncbi:MAG TPA: hypothetical protein VFC84_14380 [Desulfosporosinus sp.]|nr:hypothetical protein [Desulfosporosinus sp.]